MSLHMTRTMEFTTSSVNPTVSYGLWVIMMCQHRFIDYKEHTTVTQDVHNGGGLGGGGGPSTPFCRESKTALKITVKCSL